MQDGHGPISIHPLCNYRLSDESKHFKSLTKYFRHAWNLFTMKELQKINFLSDLTMYLHQNYKLLTYWWPHLEFLLLLWGHKDHRTDWFLGHLELVHLSLGFSTTTPTIFCMVSRLVILKVCIIVDQALPFARLPHIVKLGVCGIRLAPFSLLNWGGGVLVDPWSLCFCPPWNLFWLPLFWWKYPPPYTLILLDSLAHSLSFSYSIFLA